MSSKDRARLGELAEIRQELRELRWHIDDPALRADINDWIDRSHAESDADTAREYVEQKLNELLAEYPMYHGPDLERGVDAFPDQCADCRHYGSACPVLQDDVEVQWRERKLEQATTEQAARRVYQQQAIDVSCIVIPELLEQWDNRHADFVRNGEDLVARVEEAVRATDDAGAVVTDGGR